MTRTPRPPSCLAAFLALAVSCAPSAADERPVVLSLERALEVAYESNPSLELARQVNEAAEARIGQVRARLLPQVTGTVNTVEVQLDRRSSQVPGALLSTDTRTSQVPAITLQQLVTDFGRTRSTLRAAREFARGSAEDVRTARLDIRLGVEVAYHLLVTAQRRLVLARETVAQRETFVTAIQVLVDQLLRSGVDATRARISLTDAQLRARQAQLDLETAGYDLIQVLGVPEMTNFTVIDQLDAPSPPAALEAAVATALERRPELIVGARRVTGQKQLVRAAKAEYLPAISATSIVQNRDEHAGSIGLDDRESSLLLQMDVPVFRGFGIGNRVKEAQAITRVEEERLEALRQAIVRDVRNAASTHHAAFDRIAMARDLVAHARSNFDLVLARYEEGFATIIEVVDAQVNIFSAQDSLIGILASERIAEARLRRVQGL